MKIDWKSREVKIALTVFVTAAALIMFYRMVEDIDNLLGAVCAGVVQVFDILLPFLMGALIAYILLPLVRWVNKKLYARFIKRDGVRWAVSVGTIFLLVVAAVAGLFAYLVPVLVSNIQEFAANFSDYLEKGQDLIERLMTENVVFSQPAVREGINNALEDANEYIRNSGKEIAQTALITLKAVGTALTDTVVAIMTGLYLLIDNERLKTSAKRLTNSLFKPERAEKIFGFVHDSDRIFGQYVRARLFESLVVFAAMLIGYTVVPVPYAVLFSIVGAVTNLVPFFAPIAGFLIVVPLVLLIRPERALYAAVFIIVLQQFDGYVLGPKVMGDGVNLRPLWILMAVTAGGALFGVPGMVLGVPVAALIGTQLSRFTAKRVGPKPEPEKKPSQRSKRMRE